MRMWRLRLSLAKWSRRSKLQLKGIGEGSYLQKVHYRQCGRGELPPFCNKIAPVVYISRPVVSEGQVEKSYEQEQKFQSGKRWKEFA